MGWIGDIARGAAGVGSFGLTEVANEASSGGLYGGGSTYLTDSSQAGPGAIGPLGKYGSDFTSKNGTANQSTPITQENLPGALDPAQFRYGNFSDQANADRGQLQGYIDQTRGQVAPQIGPTQLQRTPYNYAGIDPGLVAQSQDAGARAQQAGLSQGVIAGRLATDQTGQGQDALVGRLNSDLNGGQPSLAAQQLAAGQAANNRQALSMAAGARGGAGNQVAALRAAMQAGAAGNQTLNAQQGMQRAQEYAQARGELGTALGQQRSQNLQATGMAADVYGQQRTGDLNASNMTYGQGLQAGQFQAQQNQFDATQQNQQNTTQANIDAQTAASNANLDAQQRALAQQGTLGYGAQQQGIANADMSARDQFGNLINSRDLAERGLGLAQQKEDDANMWKTVGTVAATAAPFVAAAASDERGKENIKPEFSYGALDLRGAPGFSYDYKDPSAPGAAPGRHFGPMAQDLERTGPAAASTVIDGPDGRKMVDTGRLALVNTAAISDLQRKLSDEDYKTNVEAANGGIVDPWASSRSTAPKSNRPSLGAKIGQVGASIASATADRGGPDEDPFRFARASAALSDRRTKTNVEPLFTYGERTPFDFLEAR